MARGDRSGRLKRLLYEFAWILPGLATAFTVIGGYKEAMLIFGGIWFVSMIIQLVRAMKDWP